MRQFSTSRIDCVVLTAFDSTFSFLRNTWTLAGIRTHRANTLEEADFLLIATEATVFLSDVATADCSWRTALHMIGDHHPLVAVLVMADPADGPFLEDAPQLGVCGIIWKPIQFDSASRLVRTAHQACHDRHLLREEYAKSGSLCLHGHTVRNQ